MESAVTVKRRVRPGTHFLEMELTVETEIVCPHCGESFPLQVDTSQGEQSVIEDCTVCCRPIALTIHSRPGEIESVCEEPG